MKLIDGPGIREASSTTMVLFHLYRTPALSAHQTTNLLDLARRKASDAMTGIGTEFCFNVAATSPLTGDETHLLRWLLAETFEPKQFSERSFLTQDPGPWFSRSAPA